MASYSHEDKEAIAAFPYGSSSEGRFRRPNCAEHYGRSGVSCSAGWQDSTHPHWTSR